MGLATFMVDSAWARRNCKKDNNYKKQFLSALLEIKA
jgi:hypothetical protein